jgi:predicted CoA-binding protein
MELKMTLKEVFDNHKTIAVYGMSKNSMKAANYVPAYLRDQGYTIIPVNPTADEIDGLKCYHSLAEVPDSIEILNVFRPSADIPAIVEEAIARKNSVGDIKVIWLQESIESEEGEAMAQANGITFIQDKCLMKEHRQI